MAYQKENGALTEQVEFLIFHSRRTIVFIATFHGPSIVGQKAVGHRR